MHGFSVAGRNNSLRRDSGPVCTSASGIIPWRQFAMSGPVCTSYRYGMFLAKSHDFSFSDLYLSISYWATGKNGFDVSRDYRHRDFSCLCGPSAPYPSSTGSLWRLGPQSHLSATNGYTKRSSHCRFRIRLCTTHGGRAFRACEI